jgi:ribonuclease HII
MRRKPPSLSYERRLWAKGLRHVAGVDEVGRGALAGPVVAAAVVISPSTKLPGVRDSKQLNAKQRQEAEIVIKQSAIAWAIGHASVKEIAQRNIYHATHLAMRRAINNIRVHLHAALIDGLPAQIAPSFFIQNIVQGDQKSLSIAAASIIAKVYRDNLMIRLSHKYPMYGFDKHKGYATADHAQALRRWGIAPCHRITFAPIQKLIGFNQKAPERHVL